MPLTNEKFQQKQNLLVERTSRALDMPVTETRQLLQTRRQQSVRLNTLKRDTALAVAELEQAGVEGARVPWMDHGLFIKEGLLVARDSTLAESGAIYIQNAASWLPVLALEPTEGESILDMCAAPGGKTSHIAQLTDNKAALTANDNSRPRLHKLQRNLTRLGVENVTYTLHDATRLARCLEPASFDKILLDAPCSGEGMMTLDSKKDFESWSVAHIKRLQQLQKKLIVQAWQLLKPGGTLVYSTCTMAPEENEAVIDYLLRHNNDAAIEPLTQLANELDNTCAPVLGWNGKYYDAQIHNTLRLRPSEHVEAFFVAKIRKS